MCTFQLMNFTAMYPLLRTVVLLYTIAVVGDATTLSHEMVHRHTECFDVISDQSGHWKKGKDNVTVQLTCPNNMYPELTQVIHMLPADGSCTFSPDCAGSECKCCGIDTKDTICNIKDNLTSMNNMCKTKGSCSPQFKAVQFNHGSCLDKSLNCTDAWYCSSRLVKVTYRCKNKTRSTLPSTAPLHGKIAFLIG